MLNNPKIYSLQYGKQVVTIEIGRLAKQADGAALISCEGTQVLVTVCSAREVNAILDFFPLLIEYKEKFYAAGKFLGGFMKRESRPTNAEILIMRLIDRPLRPLFPEGYMNETIITAQVLSHGGGDPEVLAGLGAAVSLAVSDIPFNGPIGYAKVGRVDNHWILNPNKNQLKSADIELLVAGTDQTVLMVEGEASEVTEAEMLDAIKFGHSHINEFCRLVHQISYELGIQKRDFNAVTAPNTLMEKSLEEFSNDVRSVLSINDKQDRTQGTIELRKKIKERFKGDPAQFGLIETTDFGKEAAKVTDEIMYQLMRADILDQEKRIAGRGAKEVRKIETETSLLNSVHGSALFTRGETQVLAAVTIGGKEGEQMFDSIHGVGFDKFYLHYSMPPFSVGEAKGYRGVGRREIGHGNLAERALKKVMPGQQIFPYTVRVACEVLESNGSSSMGSVCSGSMALMDAGVPLTSPVAGIAMGLIKEGERYKILTDILGDEDHLGDMDFKLAGTVKGITAIQMDMKIAGISETIFREALVQAKEARLHILKEMEKSITKHREGFKMGVPQIKILKIAPDKIGALIGPGGKNIKALQETFKVTMDVGEDGTVKVLGVDLQKIDEVIALAEMQINGPKVGAIYHGQVMTIKEYGAFVDIVPGLAGLLHVSEIANEHVSDVSEYITEGDMIEVKVLEIDRFGKIKLTVTEPLTKIASKTSSTAGVL